MKTLQKRFDCKSFENSQENVPGGVYFSKAASLTKISIHKTDSFQKMFRNTSCLKRTIWKSS